MAEKKPQTEPARPMVELLDADLRRIAKIIGIMLIIGGGLLGLVVMWPVIAMIIQTSLPFLVALILAYIFHPVVTFFQKKMHISRVGGVLFLYLVFILAVAGFFAILLPILITQIKSAYEGIAQFISEKIAATPEYEQILTNLENWLRRHEILGPEEHLELATLVNQLTQMEGIRTAASTGFRAVGGAVGGVLAFVYKTVTTTIGVVIALTFVVLVNIYLLLDFSKLHKMMEVMIPEKRQARTFDILQKMDVAVGGFIRGILITAFLVGLLTFLGLWVLGLKQYALLIGVIAGLGNLVPYMGPIAGGTPALLYVIFSETYETSQERIVTGLMVIALIAAIQVIEGFVFQPKIVGQNAQLHPIAVLFALALGANFGILGMIVAVPLACVARVLVKEFYWDRRQIAWEKRHGQPFSGKARKLKQKKA